MVPFFRHLKVTLFRNTIKVLLRLHHTLGFYFILFHLIKRTIFCLPRAAQPEAYSG